MIKSLRAAAVVLAVAAGSTAPALAITGNWQVDNAHPFVGLVVFYDSAGNFSHRCTGSLISPTKLLTAGHCTAGTASARVYFQQDAGANFDPATGVDPVSGYPETCAPGTLGTLCATASRVYDDDFVGLTIPNTRDVGVVMLDQAILMPEYGQLPLPGTLDALDTARGTQGTEFTISGYGLTLRVQANSALSNISFRSRLMAKSTLVNLGSALNGGYNLQTQGNGSGRGGTCSGDSGGPIFLGGPGSNLIVAVTSFGLNSLCRGTDFNYRVDRQEVLDWINTIN
ncbi:MAG: trypsin-like serine protease [Burkholderiales bacterium]|nr:trypsin-like serine protease [Burkholderiales bacterium]